MRLFETRPSTLQQSRLAARKEQSKRKAFTGKTALSVGLLALLMASTLGALGISRFHAKAAVSSTAQLAWAPPQLTNPITINITQSNRHLTLSTSQDYILKMPATPLQSAAYPDLAALFINGGHNIILIGGEINIPDWPDNASSRDNPQRLGVYMQNQTGTVHIEGLLIDGSPNEGFDMYQSTNAVYQLENIRVENMNSHDPANRACGGPCDNHPDLIQPFGGAKAIRVDHFTGESNYQGFTMDSDLGAIQTADLRNANIRSLPYNPNGMLFWQGNSGGFGGTDPYTSSGFPQVNLSNMWIKPPSTRRLEEMVVPYFNYGTPLAVQAADGTVSWPGYSKITGFISPGDPPNGDFVPQGVAGINYVSPGYSGSSAPTPAAANGMSFEAKSGSITAPFQVTSGTPTYVSQTQETSVPATGGEASYTFTVPTAGNYTVKAMVNAPSLSANSFYANIDGEPTDPTMIWDIPVTTGFEQRVVSWRGNGTPDADQFSPQVFSLTAGTHTLIIRGREANTQLASLTIVSESAASPAPTPGTTSTPTLPPTSVPATNLLQNGSFENGLTSWQLNVTAPAAALGSTTTQTAVDGTHSARLSVSATSPNDWYAEFVQGNLSLQAGKTYTLSFWAKASKARSVFTELEALTAPYTVLLGQTTNVTTSWQHFTYTYTVPSNVTVFLGFNLANATGTVYLDNVSLSAN